MTISDLSAKVRKILHCPECGERLYFSVEFWGCPNLHGKLYPEHVLVRVIRDAIAENGGPTWSLDDAEIVFMLGLEREREREQRADVGVI